MNQQSILIAAVAAAAVSFQASADIKVNFAPEMNVSEVIVNAMSLSDMSGASAAKPQVLADTLKVVGGNVSLPLGVNEIADYRISFLPEQSIDIFAAPGDNLLVQMTSPTDYTVNGTPLMDGINDFRLQLAPIDKEYESLLQSGTATREKVLALASAYEKTALAWIEANPESPAVAYALLELEGENFMNAFSKISPSVMESPFYPFASAKSIQVAAQIEKERKQAQLASGSVDAPVFTLRDLKGADVSLASFKGKWVVLDFWGSWCKWCIKGFPELKKAYDKYKGRLEVIGIDNNESEADWKAGVERFKLPWVNVYNPGKDDSGVAAAYGVQGFPTKVIINPEGKIVDITTGEDPDFFTRLDAFLAK